MAFKIPNVLSALRERGYVVWMTHCPHTAVFGGPAWRCELQHPVAQIPTIHATSLLEALDLAVDHVSQAILRSTFA